MRPCGARPPLAAHPRHAYVRGTHDLAQVTLLLFASGKRGFAVVASSLLVLQFVAVYFRVLPYLHSTFGPSSALYRGFLWFGFPFGMLILDGLMFLEPFGLLPVVPLPERMRQFIPACARRLAAQGLHVLLPPSPHAHAVARPSPCLLPLQPPRYARCCLMSAAHAPGAPTADKSTRIIAEVLIESLPQCLLQSFILLTVMHHVRDGAASESELYLLGASLEGSTFAEILPRSIAISTVGSLAP